MCVCFFFKYTFHCASCLLHRSLATSLGQLTLNATASTCKFVVTSHFVIAQRNDADYYDIIGDRQIMQIECSHEATKRPRDAGQVNRPMKCPLKEGSRRICASTRIVRRRRRMHCNSLTICKRQLTRRCEI